MNIDLSLGLTGFQDFLASFGSGLDLRWGDLARKWRASTTPGRSARIDSDFRKLRDKIAGELSRFFPGDVCGSMEHALLAHYEVANTILPQLSDLLLAQLQVETWCYAEFEGRFYREHFVHPMAVLYNGVKMLEAPGTELFSTVKDRLFSPSDNLGPISRFWRAFKKRIEGDLGSDWPGWTSSQQNEILWAAWYVASACHDIAQPYDFLFSVEKAMTGIGWWGINLPAPHDLSDHLDGHLWWEYFRWAVRQASSLDSGKSSAMGDASVSALAGWGPTPPEAAWNVLNVHARRNHSTIAALWIETIGRDIADQCDNPEARHMLVFVYELAAAAVLTHDWAEKDSVFGVEQFCDFDENPLGWVLLLSDLLECWARPYRYNASSPGTPSSQLVAEFAYPFDGVHLKTTQPPWELTRMLSSASPILKLCKAKIRRPRECPDLSGKVTQPPRNELEKERRELGVNSDCFLFHFEQQMNSFLKAQKKGSPLECSKGKAFWHFKYEIADPPPVVRGPGDKCRKPNP